MTASYRKQFTETLANLFLAEFGSLEDGIKTVSEKASVSSDTLVKFLSGEDYPSMQTAARIGKCISILNDDPSANFGFLQLATAARNEFAEFSSTETEENKETKVEVQEPQTPVAEVKQEEPVQTVQEVVVQPEPAPAVDNQVLSKINELEAQLQEYRNLLEKQKQVTQTQNEITDLLYLLEQRAKLGIDKGWLPPAVHKKLFKDISQNNAYASFSSVCNDKEIDPYVELYAISYALDLFESFGNQMAMFSSTEPETFDNKQIELEKQIEKQAELNFKLFKQNGAFLVDYPTESKE